MRIKYNGNVGIGTPSPGEKLHIKEGRLRIDGVYSQAGLSPGIRFYGNGSGGDEGNCFFGRGASAFNGIGFYFTYQGVGDWEHVFLDNGNVGIGTNTPEQSYYLHSFTTNSKLSTISFLEEST